jgi:hypothetical protein
MCVIYNYFSITLTKILNKIETVSTDIQESIFGQINLFSFLNVDSNIKMQIYMVLVILDKQKIKGLESSSALGLVLLIL